MVRGTVLQSIHQLLVDLTFSISSSISISFSIWSSVLNLSWGGGGRLGWAWAAILHAARARSKVRVGGPGGARFIRNERNSQGTESLSGPNSRFWIPKWDWGHLDKSWVVPVPICTRINALEKSLRKIHITYLQIALFNAWIILSHQSIMNQVWRLWAMSTEYILMLETVILERISKSPLLARITRTTTRNLSNVLHENDSQIFQFYPQKMRKSRHFLPKIENGRCFTHLFWTNCQFLCN